MVILKYHLTEEEYFDFNYYTGWAAPEMRGYRIRYTLRTILTYVIVALLYLLAVRDIGSVSSLVIFGAIAILYFFFIPVLVKRGVRQRVRSMIAKPENRHVLEESEVVLMDTGIIDKDNASETKYTWEAIVRKAETPAGYYLYTNTHHAIVIPKRVLANLQEKQELERLLNQHLPLSSEFPDR